MQYKTRKIFKFAIFLSFFLSISSCFHNSSGSDDDSPKIQKPVEMEHLEISFSGEKVAQYSQKAGKEDLQDSQVYLGNNIEIGDDSGLDVFGVIFYTPFDENGERYGVIVYVENIEFHAEISSNKVIYAYLMHQKKISHGVEQTKHYMIPHKFDESSQVFSIDFDEETSRVAGKLSLNFCYFEAIFSGHCDLEKNQIRVDAEFDLKANLPSKVEAQGSVSDPHNLGTAPVFNDGMFSTNDELQRLGPDQESFYRVLVQAGKRYVVDLRTPHEFTRAVELPFSVYEDPFFLVEKCRSTNTQWGNFCTIVPTSNTLFVKVDKSASLYGQHIQLSVYEDVSEMPLLGEEKDLEPGVFSTSHTVGEWYQSFNFKVEPNSDYTFEIESNTENKRFSASIWVYSGSVLPTPAVDSCNSPFGDGVCLPQWIGDSSKLLCRTSSSSNSCSFKSTNEFVTVVFNSRPWSKGMQYSLRMTNGGIYYLSEGSLASPEPLGAAPVLNRVGTLGMQSSFYRVSVDSSKQYKVSITPLEFADGSSFSFSASVVDLNDPFKEISACYGMEEGVNCHVESTTNEIRIAVSSSQYSRLGGNTSGGKFLLSVQEANVSFPSENKNLVEQDLPYEGSVGVRGSEYEIDLRPDVIYKVSFTQPEFEYVPLHLWVGNGLHSCFGSYWLPNEWYCYFVANEVQAARITVRPDNWRVGESTVVGSPFELNIVEAAEGEIKTSDGWGEYKTIPLNEDVSGYVGLGNANYQIDVEPNTNYQISLNYSSADIYVRVGSVVFGVEQKNACSIYSYLLRPSQCIITTGESEDRVYIEVEKNISQQAEFVINISAVVVD